MSIRNKNAMGQVKTPAQNHSRGGTKINIAGSGVTTHKGTGVTRPADAAHKRAAMPVGGYKHTSANAHYMGESAKSPL